MPRYSHSLNILMEPNTVEWLHQIAEQEGHSVAWIVRQATNAYIRQSLYGRPICANGQACSFQQAPSAPAPAIPPVSHLPKLPDVSPASPQLPPCEKAPASATA